MTDKGATVKSLQDSRDDLTTRLNTVNYVCRNYPDAVLVQAVGESDKFVDASVTSDNATGLTFRMIDHAVAAAMVRPYVTLKRRAGEETPVRIYSKKEYRLAPPHIALVLNSVDCKKVFPLLEKIFRIQENSKVA